MDPPDIRQVVLTIQYWIPHDGIGPGYRPRFEEIRSLLEAKFGDKIAVFPQEAPGLIGFFEVRVLPRDRQWTAWRGSHLQGKLLHSKDNGDGFIDTDAKLNKVIKAVEDELAARRRYIESC